MNDPKFLATKSFLSYIDCNDQPLVFSHKKVFLYIDCNDQPLVFSHKKVFLSYIDCMTNS